MLVATSCKMPMRSAAHRQTIAAHTQYEQIQQTLVTYCTAARNGNFAPSVKGDAFRGALTDLCRHLHPKVLQSVGLKGDETGILGPGGVFRRAYEGL